ncbi:alpha/beta hydrolase [Burkholderia guangdongensis]|uniref:alpha/beta hydrolase n=1 Tax=Burkholderia guangdongensis TaxID=1792500 RepID=UPI0015C8911C|nr:alpha/beta fold hydrolase [Burkholderia guangdongensis]
MHQFIDQTAGILCEDLYLPLSASGVRLHLRRKYPASGAARAGCSVIVFVHGATYSGVPAFDPALPGGSWLDFVAACGHDAYAIDIRGYGLSSPPGTVLSDWRAQKPYARTDEAIADLSAAVDFILARTGADRVDLVGWSWGTAISGGYASTHEGKVGRLVLYAPLWIVRRRVDWPLALAPLAIFPALAPLYVASLAAFRTTDLAEVRRRWFRGLDSRTAAELCPDDILERWWQQVISADPVGAAHAPPRLTVPTGVVADLLEYWAAGVPTYDPARITVPVMLILGEWDVDTPPEMAQELFSRLTAAPYKRLEVLGRGTHSMSLEANRFDLYQRVGLFLSTPIPSFEKDTK